MQPYPITLLNDGLLHATVEMVADTTADRITGDDREALAEALRKHLNGAVPFQVMADSPIANKAGALLDLSPDGPLVELTGRVRDAFREARGPDVIQHDGGRHHMSLGYSWATADSDRLQSTLRRIAPSHAPFHVNSVHLLEIEFREKPREDEEGTAAWEISWDPVATIPLGGST
ncbi:2'-5' RNA ligase family protein [Streptomyces inhibens]|uniref:2'-5' RNA ligase family protein n=1 Tax=Streptomyces inhibens TaxID=2293571 RepID=UPI00402A7A07